MKLLILIIAILLLIKVLANAIKELKLGKEVPAIKAIEILGLLAIASVILVSYLSD